MNPRSDDLLPSTCDRRAFLRHAGGGLGAIALQALLADEARAAGRIVHRPARCKRVVQLFMAGGASAIDLFDHKPELWKRDGQPSDFGEPIEAFQDGLGPWLAPQWPFAPHGESRKMLGETVAPLGAHVDDLAFVHDMTSRSGVHSAATLLATTGFTRPGFPGAGCWVGYGLGSANDDLPTFVVLPDHRGLPSNGSKNWDSAFLPTRWSGTPIDPNARVPIVDLHAHAAGDYLTAAGERAAHELQARLDRAHAARRPGDPRLEGRIRSYELAARMQLAAPEALDLASEPAHVLALYGLDRGPQPWPKDINDDEETWWFGRKCLAARRLLERGVRFVQVWSGNDNSHPRRNWDSHEDLRRDHGPLSRGMARGAAALLTDLKQRGLLEDTLVVWTTEFGRLPSSQGGKGRDHNPFCYTTWLCGAGVRGGTYGASDDFGYKPRDRKRATTMYDVHATMLHLLGLDHEQLTVRQDGADRRLTDVHGRVLRELLA